MLLHDVKKIAGLLFSIKSSKQTQRSNEFLGSEEASGEKEEKKKKIYLFFIVLCKMWSSIRRVDFINS